MAVDHIGNYQRNAGLPPGAATGPEKDGRTQRAVVVGGWCSRNRWAWAEGDLSSHADPEIQGSRRNETDSG